MAERDMWVSALEAAIRRRRAPPLAAEVEEQRWVKKEKAEIDAQRRLSAERRHHNENMRARMAEKYGLDPNKFASRRSPRSGDDHSAYGGEIRGAGFGGGSSGGAFGSGGFGGAGVFDRGDAGGLGRVASSGGGSALAVRVPLPAAMAQQ